MDKHLEQSINHRLQTAAAALKKNRMEAHIVRDKEELLSAIGAMVPKEAVICSGGSMTLEETGITPMLLTQGYNNYYYRGRTDDVTGEPIDVMRKAFTCDWYFSSSNAITLEGELYNTDGIGNRVGAIGYGPQNVIIVAGYNKLVKNLAEAEERVKAIAAPANCVRLSKENGCHITGHCINCHSESRICCTTTIHSFQREPNRIKVFLLPEVLGY